MKRFIFWERVCVNALIGFILGVGILGCGPQSVSREMETRDEIKMKEQRIFQYQSQFQHRVTYTKGEPGILLFDDDEIGSGLPSSKIEMMIEKNRYRVHVLCSDYEIKEGSWLLKDQHGDVFFIVGPSMHGDTLLEPNPIYKGIEDEEESFSTEQKEVLE